LDLAPSLAPHDSPPPDLCGNCRLCLDACPTGALVEPYVLDARRCISYLTIELRGPIPEEFRAPMGRMVFGCDICQDVCPWNRKAPVTSEPQFLPRKIDNRLDSDTEATHASLATRHASLFTPDLEWLASLSEEEFREVFRSSAVKRTKWRGLVRNACISLGNAFSSTSFTSSTSSNSRIRSLLLRLSSSDDPVLSDAARWALQHFANV
jgi:epoxyqueuosine reductase